MERFYVIPMGNNTSVAFIRDKQTGKDSRIFLTQQEAYEACSKLNKLYSQKQKEGLR